jgi:thioredoxin 1
LAQKFKIQSVPTLVLFKNGKPLWRQSGVVPVHQLEQIVNQYK